jgi:glycosyltransferase involved in cell wall biosynthesis
MAEQLGLSERVEFVGKVADVSPFLAKSELLVSPSRYEAYGLAVQDALTSGVPALVTKSAGIAERYPLQLGHLLVENTDSAEIWANAIRHALLTRHQTSAALAAFASELSRRSWRRMCEEIEFEIRSRLNDQCPVQTAG